MKQSEAARHALHVAIIMDGNGRWAQARGLPRSVGHRAGASAVRRVIEAAPAQGIDTLTLYAFSSDNWKRPAPEVHVLMRLFERHLRTEAARCVANGVRLQVIGRRDRLSARIRSAIDAAEQATAGGTVLRLRLAIDYSARDAIVQAAARAPRDRAELSAFMNGGAEPAPDVDLLIRTGGEQRLSDFLLWECAYAELYFTPVAWPDFGADSLAEAVAEFGRRQRRFGGVPDIAPAADVSHTAVAS